MRKLIMMISAAVLSLASHADEGMWQPHQLPKLKKELKAAGIKINPNKLTELTEFPMGAVVSLGGCTASFLSPKGLVATNHHCAYGSIQFNSTAENNLIDKGFLAKNFEQELPAAPGSRIYVTVEVEDVTKKVNQGIAADLSGLKRYKAIEAAEKALVATCEQDQGHRCNVYSFHGGLQYFLIKQLEIRDVRLVYAPSGHIGKYGGDIDNWMWPRHTGDFAFYRAYVGKDGKPADHAADNVPYQPEHYLKVNANGVASDDFVMVVGYPGRTNRYRSAAEVKNQFEWYYPNFSELLNNYIQLIEKTAPEGSDARVKYASTLASLNNAKKNWGSLIESYNKGDLLARKLKLEQDLQQWLQQMPKMQAKHGNALNQLQALILEEIQQKERDMKMWAMGRDALFSTANRLYRLALEKQKPDAEREPGYQERDWIRITEQMKRLDRRWDATVAKELFIYFAALYAELPENQRLKSFDKFMEIGKTFDKQAFSAKLTAMLAQTSLNQEATRLAWMDKSVEEFKQSNDPYIQLAVATFNERHQQELEGKERSGKFQQLRPRYMAALIDFYKQQGKPVYADANSTLRVTYGNVKGYSPKDGLFAKPFTTLEGLMAKHTGAEPFNSPESQLQQIKAKNYGKYLDKKLNSVQVNYLSTVDTTGGNSGSPTMNGNAEFVGLLFDGVYESVIGDWDFDPNLNRSIHVSSAYMLWVMEHVDGAQNIIQEMDVVR